MNRRRFLQAAAGTAAAGSTGTVAWPAAAGATRQGRHGRDRPTALDPSPPPRPIPGGLPLPDRLIHVWIPGDPGVTLPFTQSTLMGLDVEPGAITDFRGFVGVAYHVGTAKGNDGKDYDLETDVRVFKGTYVDSAGKRRGGTFAFT